MTQTPNLKLEALVAQAHDLTRNPNADTCVNTAHIRMIEALLRNKPPAFSASPAPEDFENARDYLAELARALDDIVYAVVRESAANSSPTRISFSDRHTVVTDALQDADIPAELSAEAEAVRENTDEFNADRRGWAKARAMAVD